MKKKILCLVLAIAMMLSLSAMVLADEEATADETISEDTQYTTVAEITIQKTYKLEGSGTSPDETFYLVQTASEVDETSEATSAPALVTVKDTDGTTTLTKTVDATSYPVVGTVEYNSTTGGANEDGNVQSITVTLPKYEHTGVYTYTLKEVDNGTAGVTYFDGTIYLVVTVIEQNGQVVVAAVHAETTYGTEEWTSSDKTDTIANTYSAGSLTVTKQVTGNLGDQTKSFDMTVTFTSALEVKSTISYGTSTIEPTAWTQDTDGTYSTSVDISLAHNEEVTFTNIPYGVSYVVEEDDYTSDGYNTTAGYSAYDANREGTIESATVSTTVTNNKEGEVDTGVILESMPYVMILAVVVVGGIALISKKKVSE